MKKLYGLIVLLITDLATFFLLWQFYYYESISTIIKLAVIIVSIILLILLNIKSFMTLSKKVKATLPQEKKAKALKRIRKKKRLTNILLTLLCLCLGIGNYLYHIANQTISTITLSLEPESLDVYLITSAESQIESATDEDLIYIGFDSNQSQYLSLLEGVLIDNYDKYAYVDYQPFEEDFQQLKEDLLSGELHALMLDKESYDLICESDSSFKDQCRILETYTVATGISAKRVDVSKEAFNVLILGVDIRESEGDIHTNTRTDTIMIASFNPKTMQASLVSIPRDTYIPLSYNGQYDKLTHAALYGVGCTIETIEDLLDIEINYYAKFNFKALVGLVDALGGIDVDVKFSFTESNSDDVPNAISVSEGYQTLNGEEALAYARHRNTQNDHVRNNSQQEVLKAILNKMVSFDTITKVNELLNVLNTNMTTNFGREEIMSLVGIAPKLGELSMTTSVIEGEDYETYVEKYDEYLWITELDDDSLEAAKAQIQTILSGGD